MKARELCLRNQDRILGRIWSTLSNSIERPRRQLRDLAVRSSIQKKGNMLIRLYSCSGCESRGGPTVAAALG